MYSKQFNIGFTEVVQTAQTTLSIVLSGTWFNVSQTMKEYILSYNV